MDWVLSGGYDTGTHIRDEPFDCETETLRAEDFFVCICFSLILF